MTRIDKEKNINKVTIALLNNPLWTHRDIAQAAWVSKSTANTIINEVGQICTKSETIEEMIRMDTEITRLWQQILVRRMAEDKLNDRDTIIALDQAAKRRSIFIGDLTDEDGWLKFAQIVQLPPRWSNDTIDTNK